jgi:hypothetical protein
VHWGNGFSSNFYQLILARAPSDGERGDALAFLSDLAGNDQKEILAVFCQTLPASAEFRHLCCS